MLTAGRSKYYGYLKRRVAGGEDLRRRASQCVRKEVC